MDCLAAESAGSRLGARLSHLAVTRKIAATLSLVPGILAPTLV